MIIYWAGYGENKNPPHVPSKYIPSINFLEPEKVFNMICKEYDGFTKCPAFTDHLKNVYSLKFPIDYNLSYENGMYTSDMYNQDFYDSYILHRSPNLKKPLISIKSWYYFFTENENLELSVTNAYFSDNDFTKKTFIIPGSFDIAKWPRPIECAFTLREDFKTLNMKRGDDYLYVKFNTDEKIKFKRFYMNEEIYNDYINMISARHVKPFRKIGLYYYYDLYIKSKYKKLLLKKIKENTVE